MKGIYWNKFIELAIKEHPREVCGFLFSKRPYDPEEEWYVFPVRNVSETPEVEWIPDRREMQRVKAKAIKEGLVLIGNVHSHPSGSVKPSELDLKFARRHNDIVRGIIAVDTKGLTGMEFHDKFGNPLYPVVDTRHKEEPPKKRGS